MKRLILLLLLLAFSSQATAQIVEDPSGGGGASSGTAVGGCSAITAILNVVSGTLACNPASVVNGSVSTAGRSILTIRDTWTSASQMFNVTGTAPASLTAETNGVLVSMTGNGSGQTLATARFDLLAGFTGGASNAAIRGRNASAGTTTAFGNRGVSMSVVSNTAGTNVGGMFSGRNTGAGVAMGLHASLCDIEAVNPTTGTSSAGVLDNCDIAANIFAARDNGTPVFTIADGGAVTSTAGITSTTTANVLRIGAGSFIPNDNWFGVGTTVGNTGGLYMATGRTPDAPELMTGTLANAWHLVEFGDSDYDGTNGACGTSACTDPGLIIHSAVQDTTQYNHLSAWGQAGGALKTLTESAATSVIQIPIANLTGAFGKFCYTVKAADATDSQIRGSCIKYTVTAKAGTETCSLNTEAALTSDASITETEDGSGSGAITTGTLTYAITCSTTPSNAVDIQINAVSSLTQTTLNVQYNVNHVGPGQPARQ